MRLKYITVEQPIGTFYLTSIEASTLVKICQVKRRHDDENSVQRELSDKRSKDIAKYCSDPDATFPTPIIIAINEESSVQMTEEYIEFDDNEMIGEVIDGQHRLEGIKRSNYISKFQLPVVLMFNLFPEEKAYVFSIINSKQTRVNMSLIYDLFALSPNRSPYKTAHETARALNKDENSPFFNRLKMLGKKTEGQNLATLSQGTFIKYLLELISKTPEEDTRNIKQNVSLTNDPKRVLRRYFIAGDDKVIYKVILNLFSGLRNAFRQEWENPNESIISKSIGFGAVIKAFPNIYNIGDKRNDLSEEFFTEIFNKFKQFLNTKNIEVTSEHFGSNEQARSKLSKLIIESLNE